MNDDNIQAAGLPASLADADPFGAPTPRSTPAPTQASASSVGTLQGVAKVPCPCACECGNDTDKDFGDVESLSAARFLRCAPCGNASHFGPNWTASEPAPTQAMGAADLVVTGHNRFRAPDEGGSTFVIRKHVVDPVEAEWQREAAHQLDTERRNAASKRWMDSLPERWRLPYEDGEELVPEVTERLERFKSGTGGDHGTSLLCIGPFGSGKTWVAYTYARAAVDRRLLWPQEIRVGTEAEIMEPIALASPWEVAEHAANLLKPTLKMLVIDDVGALGTYKNIENRHATWTKIVNWMYEHKRALILTTNMRLGTEADTPKEHHKELLELWIGPTAYERLKHMVGHHQVFRDENKRAELTAQWEAEYQRMKAKSKRD